MLLCASLFILLPFLWCRFGVCQFGRQYAFQSVPFDAQFDPTNNDAVNALAKMIDCSPLPASREPAANALALRTRTAATHRRRLLGGSEAEGKGSKGRGGKGGRKGSVEDNKRSNVNNKKSGGVCG